MIKISLCLNVKSFFFLPYTFCTCNFARLPSIVALRVTVLCWIAKTGSSLEPPNRRASECDAESCIETAMDFPKCRTSTAAVAAEAKATASTGSGSDPQLADRCRVGSRGGKVAGSS